VKGEQYVKLPREVLAGASWALLSINARRLLDFLMLEHMRQGGKCNGFLLAPRRQLWEFGIGPHYVSAAIREVENSGLVYCKHGTGRQPSYYGLAWLPLGRAPVVSALSAQNECQSALTSPVASANRHSQAPKSSSAKQHSPSRSSYQGGGVLSVVEGIGTGLGVSDRPAHGRVSTSDQPSYGKPNGAAL
jgi:hypothetical protein